MYYITHVDNISSIIAEGILSHSSIGTKVKHASVYMKTISNRKMIKIENKNLCEYVNLYFQPRNPVLYGIMMEKSVDSVAVIAVNKMIIDHPGVMISDGDAVNTLTEFYSGKEFDHIKPQISRMTQLKWWSPYNSTKRKIMAECLVPEKIPSDLIESIHRVHA